MIDKGEVRKCYEKDRTWFVEIARNLYLGLDFRGAAGKRKSKSELKKQLKSSMQRALPAMKLWQNMACRCAGYEPDGPKALRECTEIVVNFIVDENFDRICLLTRQG